MIKIYYTTNNQKNTISNIINENDIEPTIEKLKHGDKIDFNKIWFFKDNDVYSMFNLKTDTYKLMSECKFNPGYHFCKDLPDKLKSALYRLAVTGWGTLLYIDYPNFPTVKNTKLAIDNFVNTFDVSELEECINDMLDGDEDTLEWIDEGMSMGGKRYLSKSVYDNFMGIGFNQATSPKTVYRTWGAAKYRRNSWVSTTTNGSERYYAVNDLIWDKYILPIGCRFCETHINGKDYADPNEIIVRSEDLLQL